MPIIGLLVMSLSVYLLYKLVYSNFNKVIRNFKKELSDIDKQNQAILERLTDGYKELINTKVKLESFINNSSDAIVIVDLEGNTVQVNPAFEKMFGWEEEEEEVIGKFVPIVPENLIDEPQAFIRRCFRG